jgi:hypothetical protein
MIWASSPHTDLVQHNLWGSHTADLRPLLAAAAGRPLDPSAAALALAPDAAAAEAEADARIARNAAIRAAHGGLMLGAFLLLMPVGVLLSRHKWLFGDPFTGFVKPVWFKLHIYIQSLAVLAAVAGTVLIFVQFGINRQGITEWYTPHLALGVAATAAGVVQGLIGGRRWVAAGPVGSVGCRKCSRQLTLLVGLTCDRLPAAPPHHAANHPNRCSPLLSQARPHRAVARRVAFPSLWLGLADDAGRWAHGGWWRLPLGSFTGLVHSWLLSSGSFAMAHSTSHVRPPSPPCPLTLTDPPPN